LPESAKDLILSVMLHHTVDVIDVDTTECQQHPFFQDSVSG